MAPLTRTGVDYARAVQAIISLIAVLVPFLADAEDEAHAAASAAGLLVVAVVESRKRASVTPVLDPVGLDGEPLQEVR